MKLLLRFGPLSVMLSRIKEISSDSEFNNSSAFVLWFLASYDKNYSSKKLKIITRA
jgi:hypothetical protein